MSTRSVLKHLPGVAGWIIAFLAWLIVLAWLIGFIFTDRWMWSQWLWWIPSVAAVGASALGLIAAWSAGVRCGVFGVRRANSQQPKAKSQKSKRWRIIVWGAIFTLLLGYIALVEHRIFRTPPSPSTTQPALRLAHINVATDQRDERSLAVERVLDMNAHLTILTDAHLVAWQPMVHQRLGESAHVASNHPFGIISTMPILEMRPLVAVDNIYASLLRVHTEPMIGRDLTILLIDLPSDLQLSRMAVAQRLRQLLHEAGVTDTPDLAVGDFNITRGSASLSQIVPEMRHAWNEAGRGWGATYPRELPLLHIDHIFFNPDHVRMLDYTLHDLGIVRHLAQHALISSQSE